MNVPFRENILVCWLFVCLLMPAAGFSLDDSGRISGIVSDAVTQRPIESVNVTIRGAGYGVASDKDGHFNITGLPPGSYILQFSAVGYENTELTNINVSAEQNNQIKILLSPEVIYMENVHVYGVSKRVEKITDAPAAVNKAEKATLENLSSAGQIPAVFAAHPGIDIVQNGLNDFNINTRGFNRPLNRRVLVLQDHRETAMALLLAQEWNTLSLPLSDAGEMEFVRGPGSALYGANAFSGVMNIVTPAPEKIQGARATVAFGELNSIRGSFRFAGFQERWGYKLNFGGSRSGTWSQSRNINQDDLDRQEYRGLPTEQLALNNEDISTVYGSARLDYNLDDGSVFTAESGVTQAENEVYLTSIGRMQVEGVLRPWSRLSYTAEHLFFQTDYNGRKTFGEHQMALATGEKFKENSSDINFQFQQNLTTFGDKMRIIWGASHKFQNVNTRGTFTPHEYKENQSGLFAQADFKLAAPLNILAAARIDRSTLHATQISPKAALVYNPQKNHGFRLTFNRAFQTPNYAEFFLRTLAGPPRDLAALEQQIELDIERAENLPTGTVDLPLDFGFTPHLAIGNAALDVEKVHGWELGYKGQPRQTLKLELTFYYNLLADFITDLLPGVNPAYSAYQLPEGIPQAWKTIAQNHIDRELGPALTTLADGSEALVVSYTNSGRVKEWGMELGAALKLTRELELRGNYTFFDHKIARQTTEVLLSPNTPGHKVNLSAVYASRRGIDLQLHLKHVNSFDWASGIFVGRVPAYNIINFTGSYKPGAKTRIGFTISNALNDKHFELFGGSVNGRRSMFSVSYEL